MSNEATFSTKLQRIIRTGFFNFWRDGTVTLASVLVMMITLLVIGFLSFAGSVLDANLIALKNKIDINVNFVTAAKEEDILNIKQTLESLPEVALVTYVTREEALETFKERHASDPSILEALDEVGENPFGAVLNVQARDPSQYESVAKFLEGDNALSPSGLTIIDTINYFENKVAIDRLSQIISSADKLGLVLSLFLTIVSVLIAFNTIRLTIYLARDEISVMRLVGASTTYIQGPFVVVGIIYGLVAGFLTLLLFIPITYWLGTGSLSVFIGFNLFSYYLRNFLEIALIIFASGVFIGALSSALAIRKYLRV